MNADLPVTPYPAALYLATHRGNPGDTAFYARACAGTDSVLELGCGGGRVLRELAPYVSQLTGIDANEELVAIARSECAALGNIGVVRADMREVSLSRQFDRVIIPYNGVYCLLTEQDLLRCLKCAAAHLRPGGLLIFDAYAVDAFHAHADPADPKAEQWDLVGTVDFDKKALEVRERTTWVRETQRLDSFYAYCETGTSAQHQHLIEHRYLLSHQLPELLRQAGLELLVLHGDFDQSAYSDESPRFVATSTLQT